MRLRMAYAIAHANPPLEPYKISGWDRQTVKRAVLIMFNAKNYSNAIGAVANLIGGRRTTVGYRADPCREGPTCTSSASVPFRPWGEAATSRCRYGGGHHATAAQRGHRISIRANSFIAAARYGGDLYEAMFAAWWQILTQAVRL